MKNRIALSAVLAVVLGSVFAGIGIASTDSAASTKAAKPVVINVTATDFHFAFKPKVVYKHGVKYTFKLTNKGTAAHNIDIQGIKATKIIAHGATASMTITFKKAGKYPYLCDVPRHAELGMAGIMTVK